MDAWTELFAEWKERHSIQAFISDGIVDPDRYEEPHVLFVLRDMNCSVETDLRQHLREWGSGWKTWNNVGRWTKALLDGDEAYPADMKREKRREQMRRIAAVNLKKEGGGSRADGEDLLQAVRTQGKLIRRQLELCRPALIIACGLAGTGMSSTVSLLHQHVFDGEPVWQTISSPALARDWHWFEAEIGGRLVPVVGFCHPQATALGGLRGHALFEALYRDMLLIRQRFLAEGVR